MPDPTHELTTAVASGDTEAFGRLYEQWFDHVYREARRCTGGDAHFCLDVVQETMMRVIRSMKPLPSEPALARWLTVTTRCCAYDLLRRDERRRRRERRVIHRNGSSTTPPAGDDRLEWLRRELARLDESDRRLLLMRHRFGWTLQRIGEAIGLSTGAVDGRLTRLTARLRRRAGIDGDGEAP